MASAHLPVPSGFVQEADFNKHAGHEKAKILLQMKNRPTAIFAANDLIALGALAALREAGLRCPEDVSLVGFDNLDDSDTTIPALTTVDQFAYQIGAKAAQTVIDRMQGNGSTARHTLLTPVLRVKGSTARPPQPVSNKRALPKKRQ